MIEWHERIIEREHIKGKSLFERAHIIQNETYGSRWSIIHDWAYKTINWVGLSLSSDIYFELFIIHLLVQLEYTQKL